MNILNDGLFLRNPLRILDNGKKDEDILTNSFGAVLARAGTGKTALIVQLAIDTMLKKNNVIHISFNEPIDKVNTWYKEILNNLESKNKISDFDFLWEKIQSNLFIMAFRIDNFDVSIVKNRIKNLIKQKIFQPDVIIIDGLKFKNFAINSIQDLKCFAQKHKLHMWFTAVKHRCDELNMEEFPTQLADFDQLFDDILQIKPKHKKIYVESLKIGSKKIKNRHYFLNPSSMLIQNI